MLCVRCSHALPPRADRCVRCFALNPENRPAPVPRALHDSGPAAPLEVSIASDPPMAPVAISFDDERTPAPQPSGAVTEPDPAPVLTPRFAVPAAPRHAGPEHGAPPRPAPRREPKPALPFDLEPAQPLVPPRPAAPVLSPPPPRARATAGDRLLAWSLDSALIALTAAACAAASLRVGHVRYPLDFLRDNAPLFGALVLVLALAYSALLTALCGRTPGMALAGHHLRTRAGKPPAASEALLRALLALPSAALGLFGFTLALFDRRGQTLHDKLTGCVTVVD